MGGHAYRAGLLFAAAVGATPAEAAGAIQRLTLAVPAGFAEVASGGRDTREWAPSRASPDLPTRVVVLERERDSWDDPDGMLKRLHRLFKENCRRASMDKLARPVPAGADAASRAMLVCPEHDANGRGLIVVEDVFAVGESFVVVKVALDLEPFSPGVRPMTRAQRAATFATLDSVAFVAAPPRVIPP